LVRFTGSANHCTSLQTGRFQNSSRECQRQRHLTCCYLATSLPHDADRASCDAPSPVSPPSRLPLLLWPDPSSLQSTGLRTRRSDSSRGRSSNEVPGICRGRARCRPVRPFECLFHRRCHRFRRLLGAYPALDEDVAISS